MGKKRVMLEEMGLKFDELKSMVDNTFSDSDLAAPFASGSNYFDSLVIIPCSSTLNKIASGISDSLITRMAQAVLKERRKLITFLRETPLDAITLENALKLESWRYSCSYFSWCIYGRIFHERHGKYFF